MDGYTDECLMPFWMSRNVCSTYSKLQEGVENMKKKKPTNFLALI